MAPLLFVPMLIAADENIPLVTEAFGRFGEVRTYLGRSISADDVRDADILLVRSVTTVNAKLLGGSQVKFVGSATIGTDHVDQDWLKAQDIQFANAPACNAISAAEYAMSALLELEHPVTQDLSGKTLGIVGCGNVGSRVQQRAEALGMRCLVCDPPRAAREGSAGFVSMAEIAQADVITVHVPLVRSGPYATRQLINQHFIEQLPPQAVFINTSRGDVVDEAALKHKLASHDQFQCVLDVWENEPVIDVELAQRVGFATPHIAGYSTDGKVRATRMLFDAYVESAGLVDQDREWASLKSPARPCITLNRGEGLQQSVRAAMHWVYDIHHDDQALRETLATEPAERAVRFDQLRKEYGTRRECEAFQVPRDGLSLELVNALNVFGFRS